MHRRWLATVAVAVLVFGACSQGGGGGGAATQGGGAAATPTQAGGGASPTQAGGGASPTQGGGGEADYSGISGDLTLGGWSAGAAEAPILEKLLEEFRKKYPNIKVKFEPVAGDYPAVMAGRFSSADVQDLFYVDSSVAPTWIDQDLLEPLDDYIAKYGFDTSQFYEGYLNAFKGPDGKIYGFPKDGNTLGMAYNTKMLTDAGVESPPKNWDELLDAANKIKAKGQNPMCLSPGLDRSLAFIYQNGGGLLTDDKTGSLIDTPESTEAVQFYLDLFKNELGKTPSDLGDDWCGKALAQEHAAIIFEGGWLDPYMKENAPDLKYEWAELPEGKEKANLAFTVSYSIGKDSKNKEASWVLLQYLTGQEGMKTWTEGGVANPSRADVEAAEGKEVLVAGAEYARPWSFVPDFSKINDAYNNALTAEIEGGFDAKKVVDATKEAIDDVLK